MLNSVNRKWAQSLYEAMFMELSKVMEPSHVKYDITYTGAISITWNLQGRGHILHARPDSPGEFIIDGFYSYDNGMVDEHTQIKHKFGLTHIYVNNNGKVTFGGNPTFTLERYYGNKGKYNRKKLSEIWEH